MIPTTTTNEEKRTPFQLFFLKKDQDQSVESGKVAEIDLQEVKKHLQKGESVDIANKQGKQLKAKFIAHKREKEPWYFLRS